MIELAPGDVIQVDPEVAGFGACFAVVDEVRTWGVTASVFGPNGTRQGPASEYPVRLETGKFERVGRAVWLRPGPEKVVCWSCQEELDKATARTYRPPLTPRDRLKLFLCADCFEGAMSEATVDNGGD